MSLLHRIRAWWRRRRHHVLDLRDARYGYSGGWCDRDALMLVACFRLLCDFREREFPGPVDWEYDEEIRHATAEIKDLYDWWTQRRPAAHAAHDAELHELFGDGSLERLDDALRGRRSAHHAREEELRVEDNTNLARLVAIREFLWT